MNLEPGDRKGFGAQTAWHYRDGSLSDSNKKLLKRKPNGFWESPANSAKGLGAGILNGMPISGSKGHGQQLENSEQPAEGRASKQKENRGLVCWALGVAFLPYPQALCLILFHSLPACGKYCSLTWVPLVLGKSSPALSILGKPPSH